MILLLDNYDSFVHNLARYFRILGSETLVVRSDDVDVIDCEKMAPSAVVISPGPRRPVDAGCSVDVVRHLSPEIPILGVCLGHQAIGVAFGGSVTSCGPTHGMATTIQHDGQGLFRGCRHPLRVGRYHSLAIDEASLPADLKITARCEQGIIMGICHRARPVVGVQFHPESVLTEDGLQIIENFLAMTHREDQSAAAPREVTP
ncbi:MAG: aminodeoxychorismate/anthranilate synthase component II [Rubripirellula sp.]|nr:aminodeoxychorismate/anthranilate synthase component II [Rubripirellula sp.]